MMALECALAEWKQAEDTKALGELKQAQGMMALECALAHWQSGSST